MMPTFQMNLGAGGIGPDETSDAFKRRKQQAAREAIARVAVMPPQPGDAPPPSPRGIFLGTGDRFPTLLLCPREIELDSN